MLSTDYQVVFNAIMRNGPLFMAMERKRPETIQYVSENLTTIVQTLCKAPLPMKRDAIFRLMKTLSSSFIETVKLAVRIHDMCDGAFNWSLIQHVIVPRWRSSPPPQGDRSLTAHEINILLLVFLSLDNSHAFAEHEAAIAAWARERKREIVRLRWQEAGRRAKAVGRSLATFKKLYVDVRFRPGHSGFAQAKRSFEQAAFEQRAPTAGQVPSTPGWTPPLQGSRGEYDGMQALFERVIEQQRRAKGVRQACTVAKRLCTSSNEYRTLCRDSNMWERLITVVFGPNAPAAIAGDVEEGASGYDRFDRLSNYYLGLRFATIGTDDVPQAVRMLDCMVSAMGIRLALLRDRPAYYSTLFQEGLHVHEYDVVLAAVRKNGMLLRYASLALRNDPEVVLAAVQKDSSALMYASPQLRNDREVVLAAVQNYGSALHHASKRLQNNKHIAMAAVQTCGWALSYVSAKLQSDREVVMEAIQKFPHALEYASGALKADWDVVMSAVQENGWALQYAAPALKNDREIVLTAVRNTGVALRFASPELRNDEEVVLAAIESTGTAVRDASETMRGTKRIAMAAVQELGETLWDLTPEMRNDRDVVLAAVQQDGNALEAASETRRADRAIVLAAVREDRRALLFASPELQADPEMRRAARLA